MDGKRFAIGLVAGLLVGLAVVSASGGLGPALMPLASFGPINNAGGVTVASSTATTGTATTSSTTASQSRAVSAGQVLPVYSLNSTKSYVSTSSATPNPQGNLTALSSIIHSTPAISSRLASIAQQPLVSDAVILVPVLLAFLLAVLYRASLREREDSGEG